MTIFQYYASGPPSQKWEVNASCTSDNDVNDIRKVIELAGVFAIAISMQPEHEVR